jgi:hypothetical protein
VPGTDFRFVGGNEKLAASCFKTANFSQTKTTRKKRLAISLRLKHRFLYGKCQAITGKVNLHLYHYAGNNPLKYTDPDGRKLRYAEGVSEKFKSDFAKIIQYLNKSETSWYVAQLEKRPEIIYLSEGKDLDDFVFSSETNTIIIHTRSGLKIGEGKIQSPALGFLHEVIHALQKLENPDQLKIDSFALTNDGYHTVEEKRVIDKYETPAAKRMNEPVRTDHKGISVLVSDPTYSENK